MPGYAHNPEADRWPLSLRRALVAKTQCVEGGGQEELLPRLISRKKQAWESVTPQNLQRLSQLDGSKLVGPSFKGLYGEKRRR